jgi:alpha-N-arabinofuranosidase
MIKTPTWYVFRMYKNHMDATHLKSFVTTEVIGPEDAKINAITSSASCKDKKFAITLTNADNNSKRTVKIDLNGLEGKIKSATATILTGEKMNSMNTFENPDEVVEKEIAVKVISDSVLEIELLAMSVCQIEVEV